METTKELLEKVEKLVLLTREAFDYSNGAIQKLREVENEINP